MTPDMAFKRGQSGRSDLLEDKTCGDCAHSDRCCSMFGRIPADEVCDWSPIRFREKTLEAELSAMVCRICGARRELKLHAISQFVTVAVSACNVCLSTQMLTDTEADIVKERLVDIGRFAMGRAW